jgi:hypothetical protein
MNPAKEINEEKLSNSVPVREQNFHSDSEPSSRRELRQLPNFLKS